MESKDQDKFIGLTVDIFQTELKPQVKVLNTSQF